MIPQAERDRVPPHFRQRFGVEPNSENTTHALRGFVIAFEEAALAGKSLVLLSSLRSSTIDVTRGELIHTEEQMLTHARRAVIHLYPDGNIHGFPARQSRKPLGEKGQRILDDFAHRNTSSMRRSAAAIAEILEMTTGLELRWLIDLYFTYDTLKGVEERVADDKPLSFSRQTSLDLLLKVNKQAA